MAGGARDVLQLLEPECRKRAVAVQLQGPASLLGLIIEGLTNKEIGRAMAVLPGTVEMHRANLFEKLAAPSLAHLIRSLPSSST